MNTNREMSNALQAAGIRFLTDKGASASVVHIEATDKWVAVGSIADIRALLDSAEKDMLNTEFHKPTSSS